MSEANSKVEQKKKTVKEKGLDNRFANGPARFEEEVKIEVDLPCPRWIGVDVDVVEIPQAG